MSTLASQTHRWLASASGSLDQVACLKDVRNVLRLSGPTLIHFLQGLLTNDVTLLQKPHPSPLYSCILNAQGRYLHDLFLHPLSRLLPTESQEGGSNSSSSPTVLLDIDSNGKNDLIRLLKRYRLREKIEIDDVSEDWHVWARFGGGGGDRLLHANANSLTTDIPSASWPIDPRLPLLGYRTLLPASTLINSTPSTTYSSSSSSSPSSSSSSSSLSTPTSSSTAESVNLVSWDVYRRWRISLGVPEGDIEIPSAEAIALEYNIDGLNGISFTKGCYVGQELMARTHFKGVVRKRVMPVGLLHSTQVAGGTETWKGAPSGRIKDSPENGSENACENIVDSDSGKVLGSLRVFDKQIGQGLALLRLKEAQEAIDGQRVLRTEKSRVEILPKRPDWWPETWGREQ